MEQFGPAIAAIAAVILVAGPVAVGVAKLTDFIRNLVDAEHKLPSFLWNVVPIVLGILACVGWGINLLAAVVSAVPALQEQAGTQDFAGQVLTGILVGAMAGFWHDKMAAWAAWAKPRATSPR